MKTKTSKAPAAALAPERKRPTVIYLPDSLRARLAQYTTAEREGLLNVRNAIIIEAIDQMLERKGY